MAVRVKKARRSSWLACGCHVQRGRQIVKPDADSPWICMDCFLGARDEAVIRQLGVRTGHPNWPRTVPPLDYDSDSEEPA